MSRFSTELQNYFFSASVADSASVTPSTPSETQEGVQPDPNTPNLASGFESESLQETDLSSNPSDNEDIPKDDRTLTVLDLLDLAGERTFGVLLVLLALPSALPIPAPGYSTPFGFVIVLIALQMMVGRHRPWFPGFVRNHSIQHSQARRVVSLGLPWLRRLEGLSRPRFALLCTSRTGHIIIGLVIMLMGLCMMIPVPGTNTIPAMIVFILGFSLIEEDGLISLFGLTAGVLGGSVVAIALIKGLPLLWSQIQSLFAR